MGFQLGEGHLDRVEIGRIGWQEQEPGGTLFERGCGLGRCVIVEEDWYSYGVGAELAATIQEGAFDYLDAPIKRVAQAEIPLPYAKVMEQAALPKAQNLIETIKSTLDASGYHSRRTS